MNASESYDCQFPCTSTATFFPPISSITQSFSSGKSDIDLLQMDMSGRIVYRYQNNYNSMSECSATPDSGIQSSADSPPADPFTPPMPSPTPYIPPPPAVRPVTGNGQPAVASSSADDFSDMPRLVPFHQMEEASSPVAEEEEPPPFMMKATSEPSVTAQAEVAASAALTAEAEPQQQQQNYREAAEAAAVNQQKPKRGEGDDNVPKIAITPAMNVSELVEQLMSHMDAEQRKQFASAIQSKVAVEDAASGNSCDTVAAEDTASTITSAATATDTINSMAASSVADDDTAVVETLNSYSEYDEEAAVEAFLKELESSDVVEASERCNEESEENKGVELKEQIVEKKKRRKRKMRDRSESEEAARKSKKRFVEQSSIDVTTQCLAGEDDNVSNLMSPLSSSSIGLSADKRVVEKHCEEQVESKEQTVFMAKNNSPAERMLHGNEEITDEMKDEQQIDLKKAAVKEPAKPEPHCLEYVRQRHQEVRRKIDEQFTIIIDRIVKQFAGLRLMTGTRMSRGLPWYRLDWKEITQRLNKQDDFEKSTKKKPVPSKRRIGGARRWRKSGTSRKSEFFVASATPSTSKTACEKIQHSSSDYIKIKQNIIVDAYAKIEQMQCSCSSGCCGERDECLNRVVLMECDNSCPRNSHCTNKRMSRRECVDGLKAFETTNGCGLGVKTVVDINPGQFVCEYVGEVVSLETFNSRSRDADYRSQRNHYALNLCPGFVVDAYRKGNIARFINHSCAPNCEMQRWSVNGQYRIGLFALRAIKGGEELTYDYNWDAFEFDDVTICRCGAPNCRRFLNKNVVMSSREKEIARDARLLLLRNVRKSAALKLEKFTQGSRSRSRASNSVTPKFVTDKDALFQEILSKFEDSKVASKKLLKMLADHVTELRQQTSPAPGISEIIDSIEVKVNTLLAKSTRPLDKRKLDVWRTSFGFIKTSCLGQSSAQGRLEQHTPKRGKTGPHRMLAAEIDYKYLDSNIPVGSYDQDRLPHIKAPSNTDCVRCICGTTDDDGTMIQCENCNFWLHEECVFDVKRTGEVKNFVCTMCAENASRTPPVSVPLRVQPDYNFKNCTYYRTLVNSRNLQVRLSETVYVQKLENDNHKLILRRLEECTKKNSQPAVLPMKRVLDETEKQFRPGSFHRKNVRCLRIERLFSFEGHNFVFGFYYARPHEVYCEPGKLFHEKELFATNMYDTLPLDAVVGRCLALEPS
ncbi:unnamed protein product, partial [Gongylonema pulchrum]|uniref:Histone-lysine N-methyltransferase n=1 Tax=Gongylonema pulchrum TaxID=637853 RepID=A0A183CV14_9BILA